MTVLKKIRNLKENERIVDLFLNEVRANKCRACGKCVFGYEGITQLEMTLNDIMEKKGRSSDLSLVEELCGLMKIQSPCRTGEEIADAVLAATETYRGDFEEHIGKKGYKADICRKLMTYHILAGRCTGHGDCMGECEGNAVLGKRRSVHVIDQDECIQRGVCMSVREEDVVVEAGAVRPKCPRKLILCRRRDRRKEPVC